MVVVSIQEGLGNQMWQYAFSLNYVLRNIPVKYDLSYYQQRQVHNGFELEKVFPTITLNKASLRDVFFFVETVFENGEKQFSIKKDRSIVQEAPEDGFSFEPTFLQKDNTFFEGFWQHINYFEKVSEEIKRAYAFNPIDISDSYNHLLMEQILHTNAVAVHIRRGDYLQSPLLLTLDMNYYEQALARIKESISDPLFYIFSDDIEWAKQNIKESNAVFVQQEKKGNYYRDMQLMSMCKHNIIANSSFSWWAAWLNNYEKKVVIAPARWVTHSIDINALIYPEWVQIDF